MSKIEWPTYDQKKSPSNKQHELLDVTDFFMLRRGKRNKKLNLHNVLDRRNSQRSSQQKDHNTWQIINDTILCICEPPLMAFWFKSSCTELFFFLTSSIVVKFSKLYRLQRKANYSRFPASGPSEYRQWILKWARTW